MNFFDKLTLDSIRRTQDGYLVAEVKAARSGIQLYSGREVGKPELQTVRVYRPPDEVFSVDALHSYAYRPVVIDHPVDGVDAANWKDLARGITGGDIIREGDFVRVPLALMDEGAIQTVEDGKREISMGYTAILDFADGVTPNGEKYDAVQRQMRMNHLAIVSTARGGSNLRIGDGEKEPDMANKIVMVDGLSVETTEAGAQALEKLQRDIKNLTDSANAVNQGREKQITDLKAELAKKDGEMAVMKKQITDGELTPQKLDQAVLRRSALMADAIKITGDKIVIDGKTDDEIRRAAISTILGDEEAKKMDDAQIAGAFAFAAKSGGTVLKDASPHASQSLRTVLADKPLASARVEADSAYETYVKSLEDGYKGKRATA